MFLSYNGGVEAKNEVSTLDFFWKHFWVFLARAEIFSITPPPKAWFFALVIFRPKIIFAENQDFHVFAVSVDQNGLGAKKNFQFQNTL